MTSEIRTNTLTSRAGMSTVTMTDSGPMFSGITTFVDNSGFTFGVGGGTSIFTPATNVLTFGTNNTEKIRIDANGNTNIAGVTTAANFKTGVSNLHDVGLTLSGGQIDVGSNIKIGTAGVVTATSFVGSGANLTGITQTTINNNANNRLITGSGTANTLEGEANLTWDGSTLQAVGSDAQLRLLDNSGTQSAFRVMAYNGINLIQSGTAFSTGSSADLGFTNMFANHEFMRITSQGNVLIGHSSRVLTDSNYAPDCLEVGGASYANISLTSGTTERAYWKYDTSGIEFGSATNGGDLYISSHGSARIHIDSNGSTGINNLGTHPNQFDPGARSLVIGEVDGYGHTGMTIKSNGTDKNGTIYFADGTGSASYKGRIEYHHSDDSLNFGAGGVGGIFKLTVNKSLSSGNLGINGLTTNDSYYGNLQCDNHANTLLGLNLGLVRSGGTGSGTHEVQQLNSHGSIGSCGIFMGGNGSNNNSDIVFFAFPQGSSSNTNKGQNDFKVRIKNTGDVMEVRTTQNSGNAGMIIFRDGNSDFCGQITSNGANNTTSYNTSSDYRLKTNEALITDGITRVKNLKPYKFEWKSDLGTKVDGFFAHEAQTVVPESVVGTKDEVDSDGEPKYQGIDQAKLVPLLTASIQELIVKVETLEQENIALRARVTNLEGN